MENARTLSLLLAFALAACAASPQPTDQPWRLEMTSSGGIAGKGAGSVHIDSDGGFSVTNMSGKTCPGRLTEDESRRLVEAIANAEPESWLVLRPEDVCCDRIEWTLELTLTGTTHTVTWIDDPKFSMPADLRALTGVLGDIRTNHVCR